MRIYNTPLSEIVDLALPRIDRADATAKNTSVNIYVCGITPYDAAHLGHIFTFLAYDLLQRRLEDKGHKVRLVRNITDVDEPIFARAAELGEDYQALATRETERLQQVMDQLHMRPPFAEPKASQYVEEMAVATKKMLDEAYAYQLEDDIYFDITKADHFGSFSGFSERLLEAFMANRGGDPDRAGKRNRLDFLLWRGITDPNDPVAWQSPVGRGRPGWHIECSIMSYQLLGDTINIHGGGMDLIFPHHECEIAQNQALKKTDIQHWMHVAPMSYYGEKMSKSLGNLVFAHDLLKDHSPAVIRLALMHHHYRIGGEWQQQLLGTATCLARLLQKAAAYPNGIDLQPYMARVRSALDNDLDTPLIIRILHEMAADRLASDTPYADCEDNFYEILHLLGLVPDNTDHQPGNAIKLV